MWDDGVTTARGSPARSNMTVKLRAVGLRPSFDNSGLGGGGVRITREPALCVVANYLPSRRSATSANKLTSAAKANVAVSELDNVEITPTSPPMTALPFHIASETVSPNPSRSDFAEQPRHASA